MPARITSDSEEQDFEAYVQALFMDGDDARVLDALADLEIPDP